MCRRQFGSTRACYTPIKEREGVLPQGGLVHLPWPQKGLTFTPWCWHDLQTRSLCCLGGYWNCLEPAVDLTDRQEEIISFISGMPCHILGSEKIWLLLENTRKDSYFLHFYGNMWLWFYKRLSDSLNVGTWYDNILAIKIPYTEQTDTHKRHKIIQIQIQSTVIYWWMINTSLLIVFISESTGIFSSDPFVFSGPVIHLLWDMILRSS